MLLALRDAVAAAEGGPIRLTDLARHVEAEPAVVRAALTHAVARGWLPEVRVLLDLPEVRASSAAGAPAVRIARRAPAGGGGSGMACGSAACAPAPTNPHCRRCPLAG